MSISHLSLVNQKLAMANSLIANLSTASASSASLQQKALTDAVVFHLAIAVHFYIRELAELQGIKNLSSINSVDDLSAVLKQLDRSSSEVSELANLLHTADTWLNQLVRYYKQLFHSPERPKERKAFGLENRIDVVELTEVEDATLFNLTREHLSQWLDNFRALIARQREIGAEY
ncbi:MAG TPA: DUF6586 family protein [Cellvibrio sp.]|nr:DUF6586 family protein [Cellvibrio sp.]